MLNYCDSHQPPGCKTLTATLIMWDGAKDNKHGCDIPAWRAHKSLAVLKSHILKKIKEKENAEDGVSALNKQTQKAQRWQKESKEGEVKRISCFLLQLVYWHVLNVDSTTIGYKSLPRRSAWWKGMDEIKTSFQIAATDTKVVRKRLPLSSAGEESTNISGPVIWIKYPYDAVIHFIHQKKDSPFNFFSNNLTWQVIFAHES